MLGRRLISVAVLALCLLVPGMAWAAEEDEGSIAAFRLKASNGYRVLVFGSRAPGKANGALLILVGSKRGSVIYSTKASVEESGIKADLGELGQVDLEYLPLKGKKKHSCDSDGEVTRIDRGEYRGVFELHGEEGYTEARVTRVAADFGLFLDFVCGGYTSFGDSSGPGLPGARLTASIRRGSERPVSFEIKKNRPTASSAFEASVSERRGELRIERHVESLVGAGALRYDRRLRTATVSPPAPFDGSATFRREAPRRNRWIGDLTIDLPGRADVPLTGPGFRVSLVHASWSKSSSHRSQRPTLGRPLALLEAP